MLKKIWRDPVWSKIISFGITAIVVAVYSDYKGWLPIICQWTVSESKIPNWLLIISCIVFAWKIADIGGKVLHLLKKRADESARDALFVLTNPNNPTSTVIQKSFKMKTPSYGPRKD